MISYGNKIRPIQKRRGATVRATAAPDPSGTQPAGRALASGAAEAEIAAVTSQLARLGHSAGLTQGDQAGLDAAVAAQVAAGLTLRRYPLVNGDEPMLINDPGPGGPR
jgi:hypothetical protein